MANTTTALLLLQMCRPCPPGEYTISKCTDTSPTVCWPCEAGSACVNGSKTACMVGEEWAGVGMTECSRCSGACANGWMLVKQCDDGVSDRICARCPSGFGCEDNVMHVCRPGTFSSNGICVSCGENRTTREAGAKSEDECVCLFASDDGECVGSCSEGQVAVGGECRRCPSGFGCDVDTGTLRRCEPDTYSSPSGVCVKCGPNSYSPAGAGSVEECVCDPGFVRQDGQCTACKAGTVYDGVAQRCSPCPAGQYCLGRLHKEPCPEDMFSTQGSAICSSCRMNSGCARSGNHMCVTQDNCTCDDGFVDHGGECRRCPAATMRPIRWAGEDSVGCVPCPRGMECMGGAEVRSCELATFSGGNRSRCARCSTCREITVARCNATHDSVCEPTPYALAIVTLTQFYRTKVNGETFAMFALVLASSLPKAQLVKVCGGNEQCVYCFQGQCPMAKMKRLVSSGGHSFELVIEIRSNAMRLTTNVESLTQSAFLPQLAKTTMSKLTDTPFTLLSRIEHSVVCPDDAEWNGGECVAQVTTDAARTWLGLSVSIVLLMAIGAYRGRKRWNDEANGGGKISWAKVEEMTDNE